MGRTSPARGRARRAYGEGVALFSALMDVIVPVVLVAAVGWGLGRRFTLDLDTVTKISLNGLTPAFVFHSLLTTEVSLGTGILVILGYVIVSLLGCGLAAVATPGMSSRTRRSVMASAALGNNGNMGLPIALFALGQAGLDQSILIFLASVVITFTLGPLLLGSDEGPRAALLGMVRLPALWAVAAALLMRAVGLDPPLGIMRGIELLAQATLPVLLLTLGIQIGASGRPRLTRAVATGTLIRAVGLAFVALGVGLALRLDEVPLQALVLSAAMPTAVNAYLLARNYGADHRTVADIVTLSTVLSVVSAGVVTALLPAIGALAP